MGAPLNVGKAREIFVEYLDLADFIRVPSLEGSLASRLEGRVDDADLFQVHGEGFVFKGKKGFGGRVAVAHSVAELQDMIHAVAPKSLLFFGGAASRLTESPPSDLGARDAVYL